MARTRSVSLAIALAMAIMLLPAAASASSIQVVNGTVVFNAAPGEVNDVRAGSFVAPDSVGNLKVIDDGAPLTAGAGCEQIDAHSARCADTPLGLPFVLHAGDRNDRVYVDDDQRRSVSIYGEDGRDTLHAGSGIGLGSAQMLDGGRGDDDLSTNINGSGTPVLRGGVGDDTLTINELGGGSAYGGAGDDQIRYLVGANFNSPVHLEGGDGNDSYTFGPTFTPDAMVAGPGLDTLDQSESRSGFAFDMADCPGCVERVIGSPNDDQITGDGRAQAIFGGDGNDTLTGGGGPDVISGEGGDDTIAARDGVIDAIACGGGADSVTADRFDLVSGSCEQVSRLNARA